MLRYSPIPIIELQEQLFDQRGVRVLVKREDLNHPYVSGNKWWKLKYNLEEAKRNGHNTLLTFGGAYSNHIYATAAAAHELKLKSIGIIRGEETLPLNSTLQFAKSMGMEIHYVTRERYRRKMEPGFIQNLRHQFGDFYLIPEGGTNELAVQGVEEFARTLGKDFDYLCCAVGTGGTMAGLINGFKGTKEIIGIPVLKGGEFLKGEIEKYLQSEYVRWTLMTDYHFGGYAKSSPELLQFINRMHTDHQLPLDSVYTGKLFYAIWKEAERGFFKKGTTVLIIHSGGLHGDT